MVTFMMSFTPRSVRYFLSSVVVAIPLVLFIGCEESEQSPISISSWSVSLQTGQSWDFTASGGSNYIWSLRYEDTGTLSTRTGPQVTFTSTLSGLRPVTEQVLTVVGTVADGSLASAEADIVQISIGGHSRSGVSSSGSSSGSSSDGDSGSNGDSDPATGVTVSVSGDTPTVHSIWSDGSDAATPLSVGALTATITLSGNSALPGESHILNYYAIMWSGSTIVSFTLVVDDSTTIIYP
jgi:hypothetical protein